MINEFETRIKVRYSETDQMGVVHHSSYYPWFEVARAEYLEDKVASYKDVEDRGLLLPLANSHCEYKRPARYGDEVCITTKVKSVDQVKLVMDYRVHILDKLIATGYTTHAFVNKDFKLISIKKHYPDIYSKLMACQKSHKDI